MCLRASLLAPASAPAGCGSGAPLERFDYAQVIMGVRVNIAAYSDSEVKARDAARDAFAEMSRVDAALSDYQPRSEAMRLSDAAGTGPVPVSPLLAQAVRRSLEMSEASGGAFDVTIGPLVRAWREARRARRLPDPGEVERARALVGWRHLTLSAAPDGTPLALLAVPGMRLDFGGIGKGFAADRGLRVMQERGVERCLVAVAGDIAVGKAPPGRPGWRIEMSGGGSSPGAVAWVDVAGCGVSTSGDTEQFVDIDGVRYSHIVDPRTGAGVTRRVIVTTVGPDATSADAAATALCVMEPSEYGVFLARLPGVEARIRRADGPGSDEMVTPGFPAVGRAP